MSFEYDKLRGKIKEVFNTQEKFAESMNMATTSLSFRLNNQLQWTQREMKKACQLLNIPEEEVAIYFFREKVQ